MTTLNKKILQPIDTRGNTTSATLLHFIHNHQTDDL